MRIQDSRRSRGGAGCGRAGGGERPAARGGRRQGRLRLLLCPLGRQHRHAARVGGTAVRSAVTGSVPWSDGWCSVAPPRATRRRGPPAARGDGVGRRLAVEDTRRLHRLASDLGVTFTGRIVTFHESVEKARLPGLMAALADGATVLLLTDAGMPSVSDPGYTLVRAAIEAGVP